MEITKTHKIIISTVAVLVLLGVYIAFSKKSEAPAEPVNPTASSTITTATSSGTQIVTQGSGGYKIEQVSLDNKKNVPQPIPDLNRPVISSGSVSVSSEAIVRATERILAMQSRLKKDPADLAAWIELGIYQKMAGDYDGVLISWGYATRLTPTNYVAFANLGDFYAYFIKDATKSETYYKKAISVAPKQAYLYTQLADVYRYVFKDLVKAKAIIDQGLSQIPDDPNLLQMKAVLAASS
ncbi:MAG TPA: hypothetical protein VJA47_04575 [archaeon]|nr:hypothetical protein [archaeon]